MNKGILVKAGIILGFFVLVLGLALGCSSIRDNQTTPQISNGDGIYLTVGDLEITRQELWEAMLISDGVNYLTQYVEEQMLASYIDGVTDTEVDDKVTELKFGTTDPELLADIDENPELKADLIEAFNQNLIVLGYDPTNDDDLRDFVELNIAKEKATIEYMKNAEAGDALEIDEEDLEEYYEDNVYGDICVIDVRFNSETEANSVFDHFNLVPNYEGGWGKYKDESKPIDEVATKDFDSENTDEMNDLEVLKAFADMYNYMNPELPQIDTATLTLENVCSSYPELTTRNYEDMTDNRTATETITTWANYLFKTLDAESDTKRFSYTLQNASPFKAIAFKVSAEATPEFSTLTQTEKDEILDDIIDELLTDTAIEIVMSEFYKDIELEIYDPTLKLVYAKENGTEYDNKGHETLVAKLNNDNITADELFNYMEATVGTYYTIDMIKAKQLLASPKYASIYGTSYDFLESKNEKMAEHRDQLREMKGSFSQNNFASYGFSSADYTWEEFLILAFGSYSEEQVIKDLYVIGTLQPYLIDGMIDYNDSLPFIQETINEYFSLNVEHLLIYVDRDLDFSPDDYNDYVDELTGQDATDYNTLLVALEDLIKEKLDDEYSFDDIVDEFNDSLIGDPENDWADFKSYGFYIMTEDLTAGGTSLSNQNTDNYDEDFVDALKRIYDAYVLAVEASSEDITSFDDDRLVQSNFGLHFITATEGTDFELPTAEYVDGSGDYTEGSEGTTVIPNQAQIDLFMEIKFAALTDENTTTILPDSVNDAITIYWGEIYDAYYSNSGYSIAITEYILDNSPAYASDQDSRVEYLENVLEVLYSVSFPDGYNE